MKNKEIVDGFRKEYLALTNKVIEEKMPTINLLLDTQLLIEKWELIK